MRDPATQLCPLLTKLECMADGTASRRSASGSRMTGLLPPSSSTSGVMFRADWRMTDRPASTLPVNDTIPTSGCSMSIGPTT